MARSSSESSSKMVHSHSSPLFTQQIHLIDRTDDYLQSRSESIKEVERTIIDMGKIFEQLSILIHEQGEQVDMINSNVEEASLNVESGHNELLKFYQSVTSNRWLMIKIFGVLIVFVIIFVVLLAWSTPDRFSLNHLRLYWLNHLCDCVLYCSFCWFLLAVTRECYYTFLSNVMPGITRTDVVVRKVLLFYLFKIGIIVHLKFIINDVIVKSPLCDHGLINNSSVNKCFMKQFLQTTFIFLRIV